jgi:23S rRNA (pseudouridine1915-N3)-methyltransferase
MRIHLIAVGERMADWVNQGYQEYAKRLPRECALLLKELPAAKRGKNQPPGKAMEEEAQRLLNAVPRGSIIVALDEHGKQMTTLALANRMRDWQQQGADVALLVGGADGLAARVRQQAHDLWSLSPLTLPHGLVRVVVAEQIYRGWTVLTNHPYHRGSQ